MFVSHHHFTLRRSAAMVATATASASKMYWIIYLLVIFGEADTYMWHKNSVCANVNDNLINISLCCSLFSCRMRPDDATPPPAITTNAERATNLHETQNAIVNGGYQLFNFTLIRWRKYHVITSVSSSSNFELCAVQTEKAMWNQRIAEFKISKTRINQNFCVFNFVWVREEFSRFLKWFQNYRCTFGLSAHCSGNKE